MTRQISYFDKAYLPELDIAGCLILNPAETYEAIRHEISPKDFFHQTGLLFYCVARSVSSGKPLTSREVLSCAKALDSEYFAAALRICPGFSAPRCVEHARKVRELHLKCSAAIITSSDLSPIEMAECLKAIKRLHEIEENPNA